MWSDIRHARRSLLKMPGFAVTAAITLAVGIGASTAIFSMVNGILLRPLAYEQPQQLYLIHEIVPKIAKRYPLVPVNVRHFRTWQQECKSFEAIAIAQDRPMRMYSSGEAERIHGMEVSANLFQTLGVRPALGRDFFPQEDQPGHDRVVVLSHNFWRTRFNADRALLVRTITLDGIPHEVVGILPDGFLFPRAGQLLPMLGAEAGERAEFFRPLGNAEQVHGVSATDPLIFIAVSLFLIAVAVAACWLPARRAARVDPMIALQAE